MTALVVLLEQTVTELQAFLAVVATERRTLISGDIDQLPGIAEQKSALATRLARLESQRDATLATAGFGAGRSGIDAWLASNPVTSPPSAGNVWTRYLELAAEAKRENGINGKLIGASLQHNQQALAMLLGEANDATTYGADGQQKTSSGRRPLGSA